MSSAARATTGRARERRTLSTLAPRLLSTLAPRTLGHEPQDERGKDQQCGETSEKHGDALDAGSADGIARGVAERTQHEFAYETREAGAPAIHNEIAEEHHEIEAGEHTQRGDAQDCCRRERRSSGQHSCGSGTGHPGAHRAQDGGVPGLEDLHPGHDAFGEQRRGSEMGSALEQGSDCPGSLDFRPTFLAVAQVRVERCHAKADLPVHEEVDLIR